MRMPGCASASRGFSPRAFQTFRRPLLIAHAEQRQIEQPLARIIDKIERERAVGAACAIDNRSCSRSSLICSRGIRPLPLVDQRAQMFFVFEARHAVVGLRRQPRAGDAPAGMRLEHRKAPAAQKPVHQRRDEHRLARARQPGDAEPDGRIEQMLAVFDQRTRARASPDRRYGRRVRSLWAQRSQRVHAPESRHRRPQHNAGDSAHLAEAEASFQRA